MKNHKKGSLVFIDLDYLKLINDCYGHENGDRYLVCFAENMKCAMDRQDLLYRYAGDEFLILSALEPEQIRERLNEFWKRARSILILTEKSATSAFPMALWHLRRKREKSKIW